MSTAESDDPPAAGIDPAKLLDAAAQEIAAEARRHPLRTLGVAFAAGYVLGGGVPQFAVRMAATAVLRSLGRAVITSGLAVDLARGAMGGSRRGRAPNGKPKPRHRKAGDHLPS